MANNPPSTNPLLLAADASPALLPLLQSQPSLALTQDAHGYSLLHALTSYNHISLLTSIAQTFSTPANLLDEDGETALFVAETVAAAEALVETLGVDWKLRNHEGQTAEEKIREEGDFVAVSDYLSQVRMRGTGAQSAGAGRMIEEVSNNEGGRGALHGEGPLGHPAPLPEGVKVNMETVVQAEGEELGVADEGLRRRIEELASRADFNEEEGQRELRELVKDAIGGGVLGEDVGREVKRR